LTQKYKSILWLQWASRGKIPQEKRFVLDWLNKGRARRVVELYIPSRRNWKRRIGTEMARRKQGKGSENSMHKELIKKKGGGAPPKKNRLETRGLLRVPSTVSLRKTMPSASYPIPYWKNIKCSRRKKGAEQKISWATS